MTYHSAVFKCCLLVMYFNYHLLQKVKKKKFWIKCIQKEIFFIIQNGLNYGDKVYIDIQKGNKRVSIVIEDDGPGIPEDQYKNVFKPFFRLDKSRSLNQSGVGLGLAIVEDIINSHGGNIQLGRSKYNGLLVKISLPF